MSEAALIARGERAFFLTQHLDEEGHASVEGNIEASLSVPMRVGERIIGVLAVDNFFKRQPIDEAQIQPLMILANQAGAAMENAFLYEKLQDGDYNLRPGGANVIPASWGSQHREYRDNSYVPRRIDEAD